MKKFTLPKDGGLIEAGLPNGVKHTYEHIPAHIFEDEDVASEALADKIVAAIGKDLVEYETIFKMCERDFRENLEKRTRPMPATRV